MGENIPVVTPEEHARLQDFLNELRQQGRHERTLRAYKHDWKHFATWFDDSHGQPFTLAQLCADDVTAYLEWCETHEGLKPATVNRRLTLLKHYARWAERQDEFDPQRRLRIKHIPMRKKATRAPRSLDDEQVKRLVAQADQHASARDRAIIYTLLYAGLRTGELIALLPSDVALKGYTGVVTVRAAVANGNIRRSIGIPSPACRVLAAYLAERPDCADKELFIGRYGPLTAEWVAGIVRRHSEAAHLGRVTPHMLRHTFAYRFLTAHDYDVSALAEVLGHTDPSTARAYLRHLEA